MARYGEVALMAIKIFRGGRARSPVDAWNAAVAEIFSHSKSSQLKACPRGAFLGLCENGLVAGVPPGNHPRSQKNKSYALRAVELLKANPHLANDAALLWNAVISDETKTPNHQMEVVISLFNNGLIVKAQSSQARQQA